MTMQEDIARAVDVMKRGGLVAYPTDTVWGIGCDATCQEAVRRVYAVKRRPDSKALITLVGSRRMLEHMVGPLADAVIPLLEAGRPTTVVYPHAVGVAPDLLAPDGSIGVRLTREQFSASLCEAMGTPVVSTSANISGSPAPRFYSEIPAEILEAVDYVAFTRRDDLTPALPSRVVSVDRDGNINVIRP